MKKIVANLLCWADNACHKIMPGAHSPAWLCEAADVCWGGPCDGGWFCRVVHKWMYG